MKKTILITGGLGFVGKNLSLFLTKKYKVIVIDNFSSGNKNFIDKSIKIHKKNIKNDLNSIFKNNKINFIIHCAANFANQNSIDNIKIDMQSNISGTINILEMAKKYKIEKFIYLSSSCVYTNSKSSENICNPSHKTPYAISKFTAEQYVSFYNLYHGVNTISFRLYNFYGKFDYVGKYRNVIPNFISSALNNKELKIHGAGLSTRDFTYVDDFVFFLNKFLFLKKNVNGVFNFGSSDSVKIIDLAKMIIKICNSNSKIKFIPSRNWDEISFRSANNLKLKKYFSNIKFTPLANGLKETIKWFSLNNN
jgi:UDP-glucose 4-epimerase